MGKIVTGSTELTIGTINDGEYLKRSGTSIASAAVSGSGGGIVYDTQANRPAAGTQGREFIPTNGYGPTRQIDSGAAWLHNYRGFQCSNPPAYDSFTTMNALTEYSLTTNGDGLKLNLTGRGDTSYKVTASLVSLPASPYTFVVGMDIIKLINVTYSMIGICLTDGTSAISRKAAFLYLQANGTSFVMNASYATDWVAGTMNNYYTIPFPIGIGVMFFKIQDNNTNRLFYYSLDGQNYDFLYSISRTDTLTPTHCGVFASQQTSSVATTQNRATGKIFHWSLG